MDSAVRLLRDGVLSDSAAPPLFVIEDDTIVLGGQALFSKLVASYRAAVATCRSQATHIVSLLLDTTNQGAFNDTSSRLETLVDYSSKPFTWISEVVGAPAEEADDAVGGLVELERKLHEVYRSCEGVPKEQAAEQVGSQTVRSEGKRDLCLIINSLSTLLIWFPSLQVYQFIRRQQQNPRISCVLTTLHRDLHPPQTCQLFESLASCLACLSPLSPLQQSAAKAVLGKPAHGQVDFQYKRRSGRVKVDSCYFTLLSPADLEVYAAPDEGALDPQEMVSKALEESQKNRETGQGPRTLMSGAPEGSMGQDGPLVQSTMKLTLTEEERAAKRSVLLPFEHQGGGQAYQTGDFKDYLPPAAGGRAMGSGADKLGHILYVRDSASEYDSDEDPDDDLDI